MAQAVAALIAPGAGPLVAAGGGVVDQVPPWLKDWATTTFGTADKAVLIAAIVVVMAGGAALAGVLECRRPPLGQVLAWLVATAGAVVAASRPGASLWWGLPSLVGFGAAALLLRGAAGRLRDWLSEASTADAAAAARGAAPDSAAGPGRATSDSAAPESGASPDSVREATSSAGFRAIDRRRFLTFTGVTAAGAAVVWLGSLAVTATSRTVDAARRALRLPRPADPAPPIPVGANPAVEGITPYVTANPDFFRIDTALLVPQVDPATWRLAVTGEVDAPFELTFDELLALPMVERYITLACVSNEVGGDLVGNARWLGYPVRELLARARPRAGADMVLSTSADGWTAGTPLEVLQDAGRDCLLAVGMNGEPLPPAHGFPVRLVVPGLYGYVSATKWVTALKVTRFEADTAYWTTRGWSARGPIKLASRIDVPRTQASVDAGRVAVAGVAWAQHTGIAAVQVQVDDGPWQDAELAPAVSADTWRQWTFAWDAGAAGPGEHRLTVRARDVTGTTQTADEAPPAPDGATGRHGITVRVR